MAKRDFGLTSSPARFLAAGFAAMILAGSLLLSLPLATVTGSINFIDALFTAASAVCLTGLVVVDTGTFFTFWGHLAIMILILGGALGFMFSATLIFVILGKRLTLKGRIIMKEAFHKDSTRETVYLAIAIVIMAVVVILAGCLLLSLRFVPQFGWREGFFISLFHAVSAFGNAGFDLMGNFQNLTGFAGDYLVSGTIMGLFILGSLGFTVMLELLHRKKLANYSLHTKIALSFTIFLLFLGALFIFFLEKNNPLTMGQMSGAGRLFTSFFTSATRTAGFNVVPTAALNNATLFFLLILMFIGASPASTGGGVKTTTFFLVAAAVHSLFSGREEVVLFEKRIPHALLFKAVAIIFSALSLIFMMVFLISLVEEMSFLNLLFEVFSAFGTVGLSTGITPHLSKGGKVLLIITMFVGRLGPLTMLYALSKRFKASGIRYPEEKILIG